jgi:hypothetical protein
MHSGPHGTSGTKCHRVRKMFSRAPFCCMLYQLYKLFSVYCPVGAWCSNMYIDWCTNLPYKALKIHLKYGGWFVPCHIFALRGAKLKKNEKFDNVTTLSYCRVLPSAQSDQDPCCSLTNPITSRETESEQHGSWSDFAEAQAGLDPCWSQTHYVGFVMTRLI